MISRYKLAVLTTCVALCGCAGSADVATQGGPRNEAPPVQLEFEPKTIDLGDLPMGAERAFSAKVVNRTGATVTVRDMLPNCRCAKVELPERAIAPGQSVSLKGSFVAGDAAGLVRTYVVLDVEGGQYPLELRANVIRQVSWSPAVVVLAPDVVADAAGEGAFTVTNGSSEAVSLSEASSERVGASLVLPPDPIAPGASAPIRVRCGPGAVQPRDLTVRVLTSHRFEQRLDLPVQVRPKSTVEVKPAAIHFGVISKDDLLNREHIEVVMDGDVLDSYKFEGVDTPPYLRLSGFTSIAAQSRRIVDLVVLDSFRGIDLGSTLAFRFSRRAGGADLVVELPISGFLATSE
ncbi:MAG: DUF1573 domain-containing protein [Planctomycetia bacterium]|nr:DUF1573 domain-containing protein [Planctomycetia bacterium]